MPIYSDFDPLHIIFHNIGKRELICYTVTSRIVTRLGQGCQYSPNKLDELNEQEIMEFEQDIIKGGWNGSLITLGQSFSLEDGEIVILTYNTPTTGS
jgi:hypothetical protein